MRTVYHNTLCLMMMPLYVHYVYNSVYLESDLEGIDDDDPLTVIICR